MVIHARLSGAELGKQRNRLRASADLLHGSAAVAVLVVGLAVELFAAVAGVEDVVLVGEGIAVLAGRDVSDTMSRR